MQMMGAMAGATAARAPMVVDMVKADARVVGAALVGELEAMADNARRGPCCREVSSRLRIPAGRARVEVVAAVAVAGWMAAALMAATDVAAALVAYENSAAVDRRIPHR